MVTAYSRQLLQIVRRDPNTCVSESQKFSTCLDIKARWAELTRIRYLPTNTTKFLMQPEETQNIHSTAKSALCHILHLSVCL